MGEYGTLSPNRQTTSSPEYNDNFFAGLTMNILWVQWSLNQEKGLCILINSPKWNLFRSNVKDQIQRKDLSIFTRPTKKMIIPYFSFRRSEHNYFPLYE
jgi:hypothetical protein